MNAQWKRISVRDLLLCSLFAAFMGIGAFIKIPIPLVPFTLQFLFTNLAGILLGKKLGMISVGLYLIVGLMGIPVFTGGGGLGYVFQPTFGYLVGFLFGTGLTGHLVEKSKNLTFSKLVLAGFCGLMFVYSFGMVYFYLISNYYTNSPIGAWSLLLYCFILAIPGDLFLCFVSAILGKRLIFILRRGAL